MSLQRLQTFKQRVWMDKMVRLCQEHLLQHQIGSRFMIIRLKNLKC